MPHCTVDTVFRALQGAIMDREGQGMAQTAQRRRKRSDDMVTLIAARSG